MATSLVSYLGQTNGDGSASTYANNNALFLKLFAGEVLTTFETATVMKPLHTLRTISSGKSAQFPVTGIASSKYHTPGNDIAVDGSMLSAIKHAEKVINIDDLLVASTFIDRLDEMKNHYDVRSIYSTELGRALARAFDKNLLCVAALTAASYNASTGEPTASAASITGGAGGKLLADNFLNSTATGGITSTKGDVPVTVGIPNLVKYLYESAATLDKNNVPSEDRFCIVTPGTYYNLINSDAGRLVVNRDYGGGGSYQEAKIAEVAGIRIIKSNIASTVFGWNVTSPTGANNTYGGNLTRVVGLVFHKSAFGTVKLMDLSMESGYDMRLQGHLMIAKYAMGSAPLRPESSIVLCHNQPVNTAS